MDDKTILNNLEDLVLFIKHKGFFFNLDCILKDNGYYILIIIHYQDQKPILNLFKNVMSHLSVDFKSIIHIDYLDTYFGKKAILQYFKKIG